MTDPKVTETVTTPVTDPAPQVAAPVVTPPPSETWKDGEKFDPEKAQALIEKLRAENKALKPYEKKAAEFEALQKAQAEKDLTELQKLQKHNAELELQIKANARREMQRQVARELKLPDALAELLPGDDLETMKAKATELAKALPTNPSLTPSNPPAGKIAETDAEKKQRLMGTPSADIWKGGGVRWNEQLVKE